MLYTIVPHEEIWGELDQVDQQEYRDVTLNGCTMQIQPVDSATGKVIRLMSTNPADYLNPQFQPGSTVMLT